VVSKPELWSDRGENWQAYSAYSRGVTPTCSAGHTVSFRVDLWGFGVGAPHPSAGATFYLIDLVSRQPIEWLQQDERELLDREGKAYCLAHLNDDPDYTPLTNDTEPELQALELSFTASGEFVCRYRYVVFDSYASGDRKWGDYSRSVLFDPGRLPEKLRATPRLPDIAMAHLANFPSWPSAIGWTALPEDSDARRRLLEAFRAKTPIWKWP